MDAIHVSGAFHTQHGQMLRTLRNVFISSTVLCWVQEQHITV